MGGIGGPDSSLDGTLDVTVESLVDHNARLEVVATGFGFTEGGNLFVTGPKASGSGTLKATISAPSYCQSSRQP
jgi:hypothetical protein